jgi:hypothetical protein
MPEPVMSFEGVRNTYAVSPPDTQGDIGYDPATGRKYYVQWVNLGFAVWDVTTGTLGSEALILGPVNGNTLWTGFGGRCETSNNGDPITLYDPLAHRWLMSQFAVPNPYYQCIAVSQTADPAGAWHRYEFEWTGGNGLPVMNDYPKFGVWPDGYYMTVNQFDGSDPACVPIGGGAWCGAGVAVFERDRMLAGQPARMVSFDLLRANANFGGMLPSDLDGGAPPPVGAPNLFAEVDDGAAFGLGPDDAMRLWEFRVDWSQPMSSTFGVALQPNYTLTVAPFTPLSANIPQPGTQVRLDSLADRLMHRLAYRNFGSHESLVVNHTVDAGAGRAGVRWYEVRRSGGPPWIHQQGTYAPDETHRWMGSAAQDRAGNLAIGYSASSNTVTPSIRYAGRLATDPAGQLAQGEATLFPGSRSQTSSFRWGDYSMLGVDPADDCTFWFTNEYSDGGLAWRTRIGAFRFDACATSAGTLIGRITSAQGGAPVPGATVSATNGTTATQATLAGDDGRYQLSLAAGVYTVTAAAYGFAPASAGGITITPDLTVTQDLALPPVPRRVISGTVRDAATGWPLHARLAIGGWPFGPPAPDNEAWTDPVTGRYTVTLSQGVAYTFQVTAFAPGYLAAEQGVTVAADATRDLALTADPAACNAPGYRLNVGIPLYVETFDAIVALPGGGWAQTGTVVTDLSSPPAWSTQMALDSGAGAVGAPHSGPRAAEFNSYAARSGDAARLYRTAGIDLSARAGARLTFWVFHYVNAYAGADRVQAQVSIDGGATWIDAGPAVRRDLAPNGSVWRQHTVDLSAYTGPGMTDVRIAFLGISGYGENLHLDDVWVSPAACQAPSGGLVVGQVDDANTGAPLPGARVASAVYTATAATPDDPSAPGAWHVSYAPAGPQALTGSFSLYAPAVVTVQVAAGGTVRRDLHLPAGRAAVAPPSAWMTGTGGLLTAAVSLSNTGSGPLSFDVVEWQPGPNPAVRTTAPGRGVRRQAEASLAARPTRTKPSVAANAAAGSRALPAGPSNAGDILANWATGLPASWGIVYDPLDRTVWVSSPCGSWGGACRLVEYGLGGAPTGRSYPIPWTPGYGPADLTYNRNTGMIWAVDVGTDNCIHELDPDRGWTGDTLCGFAGVSMRGLAHDPAADVYYTGRYFYSGCGEACQSILAFAGETWPAPGRALYTRTLGVEIAGLAYHPVSGTLFVAVSGAPTITEYRTDTWEAASSFEAPGVASNGMDVDCAGHLWVASDDRAWRIDSGRPADLCPGIRWLSVSPVSGTLPAGGMPQALRLTFGTTPSLAAGLYTGTVRINTATPYGPVQVPVSMTVRGPARYFVPFAYAEP